MSFRGRIGNIATDLRHSNPVCQIGKRLWRIVRLLLLQFGPVDCRSVQPRRSRFKPPEPKAKATKRFSKRERRRITDTASRKPLLTQMNFATQKSAGRQNHSASFDLSTAIYNDPGNGTRLIQHNIFNGSGLDRQVF